MMKEHAELTPIVEKYREYKKAEQALKDSEEMLSDPEMKELAQEEMKIAKEKISKLEEEIKILLIFVRMIKINNNYTEIYTC